jgi:TolB-like protein/Tfp pilus assembly protein PilF
MTAAPDIFLSYNREDQAVARRFAEAFEAQGFSVWWDTTLRAGEAYDEVTEQALREAKAVVVLWSPRSVVSRWVRAEATLADRNKTLVPCTIEPCDRPIMFELTQTAELSHWQGDAADTAWQAFLGDVRRFVGKEVPTETVQAAPPAPLPLPLPSKPSIAVMPFANLSGDPDQEYFADGMVEEISNALSCLRSLFVIAGSSTLTFKGKNVAAQEAARQLGVRFVLEGSVRKAGARVRIAVKLIDALSGEQIWTHRFEDTLEDIFDLQDKVAVAVAGRIEPTIQLAEVQRVSSRPTENMGSYDLYLRAMPLVASATEDNYLAALDLLRRAITLDPGYAPALAALAITHTRLFMFGWSDDPEGHRLEGLEMAQRALRAGRDDAAVLTAVAFATLRLGGNPVEARELAARATDLNPGSAGAWSMRGSLHMFNGEADLAVEALESAIRLDPTGPRQPTYIGALGQARFLQRRFDEAVGLLRESVQHQELPAHSLFLAAALGHLGDAAGAARVLARYRQASPRPVEDFVRSTYRPDASANLILEGLALAEGESPDGVVS